MFSAANMATLASWLLHPATATLETSSKLLDTRYWHLSSFVMWHEAVRHTFYTNFSPVGCWRP